MKRRSKANNGFRHSEPVQEALPQHRPDLDEMQREILSVMRKARIGPELIYAYLRTWLMVTKDNLKFLSAADRNDWDCAIAQYFRHRRNDHASFRR